MSRFKAGELDVLVATTVIEVGVDVPNATIMIVQEADRFGLAQLHQLRGRVGRGAEQSYCLLISRQREELTDNAQERLQALVDSTDGFELAEKDLELRGEGQLMGTRQAGISGSASRLGPTARCSSAPERQQRVSSTTRGRSPTRWSG
jgi:ATP-dependent DNA helicase RecG